MAPSFDVEDGEIIDLLESSEDDDEKEEEEEEEDHSVEVGETKRRAETNGDRDSRKRKAPPLMSWEDMESSENGPPLLSNETAAAAGARPDPARSLASALSEVTPPALALDPTKEAATPVRHVASRATRAPSEAFNPSGNEWNGPKSKCAVYESPKYVPPSVQGDVEGDSGGTPSERTKATSGDRHPFDRGTFQENVRPPTVAAAPTPAEPSTVPATPKPQGLSLGANLRAKIQASEAKGAAASSAVATAREEAPEERRCAAVPMDPPAPARPEATAAPSSDADLPLEVDQKELREAVGWVSNRDGTLEPDHRPTPAVKGGSAEAASHGQSSHEPSVPDIARKNLVGGANKCGEDEAQAVAIEGWKVPVDDRETEEGTPDDSPRPIAGYTESVHPIFGRTLHGLELFCGDNAGSGSFRNLGWTLRSHNVKAGTSMDRVLDLTCEEIGTVPDFAWAVPPRHEDLNECDAMSHTAQNHRFFARMTAFTKWCVKKNPHFIILIQSPAGPMHVTPLMKRLSDEVNLHTTLINYSVPGKDHRRPTRMWSNDFGLIDRMGDRFKFDAETRLLAEKGATLRLAAGTSSPPISGTSIPRLLYQFVARYVDSKFCMNFIRERTSRPEVSEEEKAEFNRIMTSG